MLNQMKSIAVIVAALVVGMFFAYPVQGQEQRTVSEIHRKYKQTADAFARKEVLGELIKKEPQTSDDISELRAVFSSKNYDEPLFEAATESLRKMHNLSFDGQLIEILKDEKPYLDKAVQKDFQGKTEGERTRRGTNILFMIQNLGQMKSQNAVTILKDYLKYPGFNYYASEALAAIGDKSASSELRDRATKGEDVNYAGQGSSETMNVIRDLQDKNKKDQWPKIAKQIIHIKDKNAKPYLKQLFKHENMDVRWEAADRFRAMVDENDVQAILEMTKNQDHIIRAEGIHAMQNLKTFEFSDELISLLNDPSPYVRSEAAKVIGFKKITHAVPALEQALKDCEKRANSHVVGTNSYNDEIVVCEETYIALFMITDKKCDYKGKTTTTERRAERQKGILPSIKRSVQ